MAEIKTKEELTGKVYASGKILASLVSEKGAKGDPGEKGESGTISIGEVKSGLIAEVTNTGTSNDAIFNFVLPKGDKGDPGEPGEKGADGTGVNILGTYESEEILKENHPTGNIGDAYMIGGSLYVWSVNDNTWINVGNIKGEKGDKGDKGDPGEKGADGEKGTSGIVSQPNEPTDEDIVVWVDTDEEGEVLEISSYENAIESITVNGEEQEIKEKNINIIVPTKTSDLTNDNNFISLENVPREVIVSSKEPTTGEEVWIQRGKNLYNESQYPLIYNKALNPEDGATYSTSSGNYYATECYVPIDGAKISKITFSSNVTISFYDGTKKFISGGTDKQTYDVPSNARYFRFDIHKNYINNIQIEQGEVATSYESYVTKKIHTKTNDGYEEFYNEEEKEVYSISEQRIGTYLGKPLYRQVFYVGTPTATPLQVGTIANLGLVVNRLAPANRGGVRVVYTDIWGDNAGRIAISSDTLTQCADMSVIVEYTKTTD